MKKNNTVSYSILIGLSILSSLAVASPWILVTSGSKVNDSPSLILPFLFTQVVQPILVLPATLLIGYIHTMLSRRNLVREINLLIRFGIPLLFNILGASSFFIMISVQSSVHLLKYPSAHVSLTGEYSSQIGTLYNENSLDILTGVTSDRSGEFMVTAELSSGGQPISNTDTDISLVPGHNTVTIQFPGADIRHYRLDGPYQVNIMSIHQWDADRDFNVTNNTWQTSAYHWQDFGSEICFTLFTSIHPDPSVATMEISPAPNCSNGNGQYLSASLVTLKVISKPGFQFKGWGGDTGGVDIHSPVITLQIQRDMIANAFFEPQP